MTERELVDKAISMFPYSYVPYSHFPVGAALAVSYTHLTLPTILRV